MTADDNLLLRVPPHSDHAEQSILGALLLDNAAIIEVADVLRADHFYRHDHRTIYTSIVNLSRAGKTADVVTVCECGGGEMVYLNELALSMASSRNARAHAEIVVDRWRRRSLIRIGADLADGAFVGQKHSAEPKILADAAITELLELLQGTRQDEPRPLSELVVEYLAELSARSEGLTEAISTGLIDLDRLTAGGGRPGELWVVAARPGMGKSAFVLSLLRHIGQRHNALLLTMEDSLMSATGRHVAATAGVNLADLRNPRNAPESMWAAVSLAADELSKLTVYMDEQPAQSLGDVRRKVQQVTARHGKPEVLMIDYLQLMEGEGENRNREIGKITYGLQALAKELGIWTVLISQLSREADKRSGPPQMSDLRDSGEIEAAARCICMLHRQWMRKELPEHKYWAQLHVCKQSNGPTGMIDLHFDGALQRFGNWAGQVPSGGGGSY